jgi:hypothetical protein
MRSCLRLTLHDGSRRVGLSLLNWGLILLELRPTSVSGASAWTPTVGDWTRKFIARKQADPALGEEAMGRVAGEALRILSRCVPPTAPPRSDAGIVVGQVQSGKTLSFTTVISLARDNGFGLVVVLTGRTIDLQDQSEGRLEVDLELGHFQGPWLVMSSPNETNQGQDFRTKVNQWRDAKSASRRLPIRPLLVTLLKHQDHIDRFADLIRESDMADVPTLIVDDESDQAGPNTKTRGNIRNATNEQSAIYRAIGGLRAKLPHHTLLQYTATPQANLLANKLDALNPSFAQVLSPGDGYVGGRYFFTEHLNEHLLPVPPSDLCDPRALPPVAPGSLQSALRIYLLGAAYSLHSNQLSTRSMLVQVHQNREPHKHYARLIEDLLTGWMRILRRESDASTSALYELFRSDFDELSRTVTDLPNLDELMDLIPEVIEHRRLVVLNSERDQTKVKWDESPFWILVGGLKLDRGFTVKGLTVTYMPRKVAQYSDVLQQRGRFFGYRMEHIELCRIYLPADITDAFCDYVQNEESMRRQLTIYGDNLPEWRRVFLLSAAQSGLTRPGVVGRSLSNLRNNSWLWPKRMASDSTIIEDNNRLLDEFVHSLADAGPGEAAIEHYAFKDTRPADRQNAMYKDVDLTRIADLVAAIQGATAEDRATLGRMEGALRRALSLDPVPVVNLFLINSYDVKGQRGRAQDSLATNIFVGRSGKSAQKVTSSDYVGDDAVRFPDEIAVHLRKIVVTDAHTREGIGRCDVSWIALHLGSVVSPSTALVER